MPDSFHVNAHGKAWWSPACLYVVGTGLEIETSTFFGPWAVHFLLNAKP